MTITTINRRRWNECTAIRRRLRSCCSSAAWGHGRQWVEHASQRPCAVVAAVDTSLTQLTHMPLFLSKLPCTFTALLAVDRRRASKNGWPTVALHSSATSILLPQHSLAAHTLRRAKKLWPRRAKGMSFECWGEWEKRCRASAKNTHSTMSIFNMEEGDISCGKLVASRRLFWSFDMVKRKICWKECNLWVFDSETRGWVQKSPNSGVRILDFSRIDWAGVWSCCKLQLKNVIIQTQQLSVHSLLLSQKQSTLAYKLNTIVCKSRTGRSTNFTRQFEFAKTLKTYTSGLAQIHRCTAKLNTPKHRQHQQNAHYKQNKLCGVAFNTL